MVTSLPHLFVETGQHLEGALMAGALVSSQLRRELLCSQSDVTPTPGTHLDELLQPLSCGAPFGWRFHGLRFPPKIVSGHLWLHCLDGEIFISVGVLGFGWFEWNVACLLAVGLCSLCVSWQVCAGACPTPTLPAQFRSSG